MEKEIINELKSMKYYSIDNVYGNINLGKDIIVHGKNSKEAIEKKIKKPVIKNKNVQFSVVECDKEGRLHYDRRKWHYYGLK